MLASEPVQVPPNPLTAGAALHSTLFGRGFVARALDDALSGSSCGCGLTQLIDGRADLTTHKGPLQIALIREFDVPRDLAIAFEHAMWVGKGRTSRKAEIDVPRVGGDVAEHVLHLSAGAKPYCDGINLIDRFGSVGYFFEDDFKEGEREVDDRAVVCLEEFE
jgi:hypothetical protein